MLGFFFGEDVVLSFFFLFCLFVCFVLFCFFIFVSCLFGLLVYQFKLSSLSPERTASLA